MFIQLVPYPPRSVLVFLSKFGKSLLAVGIFMPQFLPQNLLSLFVLKTVSAGRTFVSLSATLLAIFLNSINAASETSAAVFLNSYEKYVNTAFNIAVCYHF